MNKDYSKELNTAINISKKASDLIIEKTKQKIEISEKSENDFVTNVDKASEKLIISELKNAFPQYDILAEESGEDIKNNNNPKWIIDPIDGTTNFMKGIPIYAVSIGLEIDKDIVAGVVYNVGMNELFYAEKGKGAFLNKKRIYVSKTEKINHIIIGTGFPFKRDSDFKSYIRVFEEFAKTTAGIRRPGSAAIDLCWLACGRYDAFFEFGLNPWDISAGALIVKEAGGIVHNAKGGENYLYDRSIVASNSKIVQKFMLEYIERYYYYQ